MSLPSSIGTASEYRGYKLSIAKAKSDWCIFVIPPLGQPEIVMADDREAVLAEAQKLINNRLGPR